MRKVHKIIVLLIFSFLLCGLKCYTQQDTMYFYYQGNIFYKRSIDDMDSLKFSENLPRSIIMYKSGNFNQLYMAGIDSIIFYNPLTPTMPTTVITQNASDISHYSAILNGTITFEGFPAYTEKGLCYSTLPTPTINDEKIVVAGSDIGDYSANSNGLTQNTRYYFRAYAINEVGIAYGIQRNFVTLSHLLASLTITNISNITENSVAISADITFEGFPEYTEKGFCYSTSPNPTINQNIIVVAGNGTGEYSAILNGLTQNTKYYVRAYAKNEVGVAYSDELNFTTLTHILATVTTINASNIMENCATVGGNITNIGIPHYTEKGVCYSTSSNPTVNDTKIQVEGTGMGIFSTIINQLSPNITYYIRAYAINDVGVSYGNQISFKTACQPFTYCGDITFTTESQLLAFKDAGYKYVIGNVTVAGNTLTSFQLLNNQLEGISGDFLISASGSLNSLTSFSGFGSLQSIGGNFKIYASSHDNGNNNSLNSLASFSGLESLQSIGGNFEITAEASSGSGSNVSSTRSLNSLTSFSGLENLQFIGGDFKISAHSGNWYITSNNASATSLISLAAFSGLENLQFIGGDFIISSSSYAYYYMASAGALSSLTSITGMGNLHSVINISITNCSKLYNFCPLVPAVENMTGTWYISGCGYNPTKYQMLNEQCNNSKYEH